MQNNIKVFESTDLPALNGNKEEENIPRKIKKKKKSNKNKEESIMYSPTTTPLTWSSNLYVQELMKGRARLEILEAKV